MSTDTEPTATPPSSEEIVALMKKTLVSIPIGRAPANKRLSQHLLPIPIRVLGKLCRPMILLGLAVGWTGGQTLTALTDHHFGVSADAAVPAVGGPVVQGGAFGPWSKAIKIDNNLSEKRPTLIKLTRLARVLEEQGESAPQIALLLHRMAEASSVTIFGRPDAALEAQDAVARAKNIDTLNRLWAARKSAKGWQALQKSLATEDRELGVFFFRNDQRRSNLEDDIGTSQAYDTSSAIAVSSWVDYDWIHAKTEGRASAAELAAARASLAQAVHDVGLAAWKVPAVRWARADLLQEDAKRLREANRELEHITGWQGGVLGLNNRLIVNNNAYGDGKTSVAVDLKHIVVWSAWDSLSHEWFHALDNTLGKSGLVWRSRDSQLSSRWETGLEGPNDGRTTWVSGKFWAEAQSWYRRMGQATEGRYNTQNDQNNAVAVQSLRALWTRLAQPNLSHKQADDVLGTLKDRQARLTDMNLGVIAPHGDINGEHLIFERARSVLVKISPENLTKGKTSPWFRLRADTQEQVREILPQVNLQMADGGYRFNKKDVVDYVTDPTEILAYAFSGHVANQAVSLNSPLVDKSIRSDMKPEWDITQAEAQADAPAWKDFFSALAPWWRHDRIKRMGLKIRQGFVGGDEGQRPPEGHTPKSVRRSP